MKTQQVNNHLIYHNFFTTTPKHSSVAPPRARTRLPQHLAADEHLNPEPLDTVAWNPRWNPFLILYVHCFQRHSLASELVLNSGTLDIPKPPTSPSVESKVWDLGFWVDGFLEAPRTLKALYLPQNTNRSPRLSDIEAWWSDVTARAMIGLVHTPVAEEWKASDSASCKLHP